MAPELDVVWTHRSTPVHYASQVRGGLRVTAFVVWTAIVNVQVESFGSTVFGVENQNEKIYMKRVKNTINVQEKIHTL